VNDSRLRAAQRLNRYLRTRYGVGGPDPDELQRAIAEHLDGPQRDLLARCWAGRCTYPYLAQVPSETALLRSLIELGLIECPPPAEVNGPRPSSRGRAVLGKLPPGRPAATRTDRGEFTARVLARYGNLLAAAHARGELTTEDLFARGMAAGERMRARL
jgi:hypothetical protein